MTAMSGPQLAEEMGVSRTTVFNRIKGGEIPATKVGRNYVISARTVSRLLRGDEMTPARQGQIDEAVGRVVAQYGELLEWLGDE